MRKLSIETNIAKAQELIQIHENDEFLRSEDVCRLFKISNSTLKNYRTEGIIPCYKLGKTYLYKRLEIEAEMQKL